MNLQHVFAGRLRAGGRHRRWMMRRVDRKLNLDIHQRQSLSVLETQWEGLRENIQAARGVYSALSTLLAAENLDRDTARPVLALLDALGDFFDGLTSEQRAEPRRLLAQRRRVWDWH